jgi:hypothetical protein
MSKDLAEIEKDNQEKIVKLIEVLTKISIDENETLWNTTIKHLPLIFKQDQIQLDLSCYTPESDRESGYKPFLLYSNGSEQDPVTFMIFAFGKNNRTKIHDHIKGCMTIVLSDSIKENTYRKIGDSNMVRKYSDDKGSVIRVKGDIQCDDISGDDNFIHRLKYSKKMQGKLGITMHVYHCLPTIDKKNNIIFSNSVNDYYQKLVSDQQHDGCSRSM